MAVGEPPLQGLKVLEFAGLAPGPYAGLLLADAGAHVLRIDRAVPGQTHHASDDGPPSSSSPPPPPPTPDMLARRKSSIAVDLKCPRGAALVARLALSADVLIDPFRPSVLEKLGLGPAALRARNPRLVYARLTGFRRAGRYAAMAGHDINYLAVSGVLALLGRAGAPPHAPWNLLADFAGGGAALAHGVLMALLARARTGRGQVVEANMVDGASHVASFARMAVAAGSRAGLLAGRARGRNLLDGGAPFYDTYETRDGRYVAVGALEPRFYALLVAGLGLGGRGWEERRDDPASWPEMRRVFAEKFRSKTRAEWERVFDGTDACCTPVLEYAELEAEPGREGDQRPIVALRDTPCLAVDERAEDPGVQGQGSGVPGNGYMPSVLYPGQGGEEALKEWFGWSKGKDFDVERGGLVLKEVSKL
ncbi:CoA-transferase family III domain-containing protein [Biscogniauxia marginata]|nr:CoA-transferase family III domain-containing protein [Biscogniauxia marginata]